MKFVFITLVFIFCAFNLFPRGIRDNMTPETENQIVDTRETRTIIGRVQVYGNSPFTFVGIEDEEGTEYAVYPKAKETELRELQGYLIEFTVVFHDESKAYGGMYLKGGTVEPVRWEILPY